MNGDSVFDDKTFKSTPYLKLIEGKEGATCLCYQMRLHGKLHFVKKIKPEFENIARMRAAFRKENEIGFSLSHPGLAKYIFMEGIFSPEEYVVTEWIEGETLDNFIEKNPKYFSKKKNLEKFIYEFADALDYLHKNGIIHGDLKPANIMMASAEERVIILDLGYSVSDAHDLTGGFSPSFASQEVLGGKKPQASDDYYSFGKILDYIQQKIGTFNFLRKNRKQIEGLLIGSPEQKKKAYYKIKKKEGRSLNLLMLAIILFFLSPGFAWFAWETFNENKRVSKVAEYNPASQDSITINQRTIEEEEPSIDNSLESNKELTQREEKDIVDPQKANNPKDEEINAPQLKIKGDKEESNSEESSMSRGNTYAGVAPEVKEKVKLEVRRQLNNYYPPLISKIDYLMKNGIYTKEWDDSLTHLHEKGVLKCLNILDYEKKFPEVGRSDLFEIVGDESYQYFEENLYKKFFGYKKKVEGVKKNL